MIDLNKIVKDTIEGSYGYSMGALWGNLDRRLTENKVDNLYSESGVLYRKQLFLSILEKLLKEDKAKLNWDGRKEICTLPIAEQLKMIDDAWPHYGSEDDLDDLDDIGLWFLAKCPLGIVWISKEDGHYIWT